MKRMLINATQPDELRVAITDDALLIDLDIELPGYEQKKSNIYKGRITSIEPSLDAVFVDYGSERHGFLPLKEISQEYFLADVERIEDIDIKKVLKVGQELVVQIEKEERGTKGAALTTFISLAGSGLVLMPNNPRVGISRRIEDDERDQLKETVGKLDVPEGMGIIIRTAGLGKSAEDLKWDLNTRLIYWEAIKQAAIAKPAPYLIHQESEVITRAIRDYLRHDIEEIIVDDPTAYERARNYITQIRPDFLPKLKLYSDHLPLFSRFQIEQQIEQAYQREVRLPSGGSIVIDVTEALVSIDINSAKATKGGSIEETAYNTNLEAAEEIPRQLRIRDIGGLLVIDFIDMTSNKSQRDVENRLRDALQSDRARIQVGRISRFGLLEMSRQRLRSSLSRSTQITCPRCSGQGTVRGVESMSLSILHLIQEHVTRPGVTTLHVQLPVDIATYLLNEKRDIIKNAETHSQTQIVIIPNAHLTSPQYQIREVKDEHTKGTPSYRLAKIPKVESTTRRAQVAKKVSTPAINEYLTSEATPHPRKTTSGIVRRLWDIMFASEEPSPKVQKPAPKKPSSSTRRGTTHPKQRAPQKRTPLSTGSKNATRRGSRGGSGSRRPSTGTQQRPQQRKPRTAAPAQEKKSEPQKVTTPSKKSKPEARKPSPSQRKPESAKQAAPTSKPREPSKPIEQAKPREPSKPAEQAKPMAPPKPTEQPKAIEHPKPTEPPKQPVSPPKKEGPKLEQITTKSDNKE